MTGSLLIYAAQGERDAVTALEAGADAVLPAGASPELACRQALAVFRRQINRREDRQTESVGRLIRFRDIVIDRVVHQVTKAGEPIELNPREYRLLTVLAEHPDVAIDQQSRLAEREYLRQRPDPCCGKPAEKARRLGVHQNGSGRGLSHRQ